MFISGEMKWHDLEWESENVGLENGGQNQEVISYTERNRMSFDAFILLDVVKIVLTTYFVISR
jgi:hypothetical protein